MTLTLSPWWSLALVWPVLLIGRLGLKAWPQLARANLPVPVVGGLVVTFLWLLLDLLGGWRIELGSKVTAGWWTWLVTATAAWGDRPAQSVNLPFLVGLFTCVGLNASWSVLRTGSRQVFLFWAIAAALAILQTVLGVALAFVMGQPLLLGVICGVVSQTGGHGTALGFADTMVAAGYPAAAAVGAAAATFGLVMGSLLGGPLGGRLIRRHGLKSAGDESKPESGLVVESPSVEVKSAVGLWSRLSAGDRVVWCHLILLFGVMRIGAEISAIFQAKGWVFPVYIGAMVLGVGIRNILDALGRRWIDSRIMDQLTGASLAVFLAIAILQLDLRQLAATAGPMLVILLAQVGLMAAFAWFVTFRVMGRDYDAAVMSAGHCGFGLGATPSAVANMDALVRGFGPAHRAFLVVPVVGAMFVDITNSVTIVTALNLLK
jgi:ESS family glutamate:Na+ symporter